MENPALELLGPTRKALVLGIKSKGHATAEDLGETCYLSAAAARMHLAGMERMGLVAHGSKRTGPGRPKNQYFLTQSGEDLFPHASAWLAVGVLNLISMTPEWARGLWQMLESRQAEALAQDVRGTTPQEHLQSLVHSPRLQMHFPELSEDTGESWKVTLRHCPFLAVARAHPVLCEIERRVFARVLGEAVAVTNLENRIEGHERCSFQFTPTDQV